MSTTTLAPAGTTAATDAAPHRTPPPRTPLRRLLHVELRKMFDTRSGRWLMVSIGVLAVIATAATVAFAPREALTYASFATAIGVPMTVILPIIAILSVTSEWSQRTALTTFTLAPARSRVLLAKAVVAVGVGVASMVVAAAVGALGNLVGTSIAGTGPVWDVDWGDFGQIVLGHLLAMAAGFTLAVLLRNSPSAIVGYFVYCFVVPAASGALAAFQPWWADHGAWFDLNWAAYRLFDGPMTGETWGQLASTTSLWLLLPLVLGVRALLRAEVK